MQAIEDLIRQTFPNVTLLQYEIWYEVPFLQHIALSPLMLISRTIMVAATTVLVSLLQLVFPQVCPQSRVRELVLSARMWAVGFAQ